MLIGASAGSTAGGFKVSRLVILVKSSINQVRKVINPRRVIVNKMDGKKIDEDLEESINKYLVIYILLFVLFMFIVSIEIEDFEASFAAVATTFNNVGPGLRDFGPITSFAALSDLSKITLTLAMLFGRLEIYPMLIIFSPFTYKNIRNK